ncbi:hypothetical protein L2E82_19641 [Cichorium intybus]|uniref:Uncharacterized protein n=1 Tax=Cichorium intybus TaxID=13427 RepID=A0ACB9FDM8_CICIN|nr:hypothetical protein L2E82_19641 [Cichorium intybus]
MKEVVNIWNMSGQDTPEPKDNASATAAVLPGNPTIQEGEKSQKVSVEELASLEHVDNNGIDLETGEYVTDTNYNHPVTLINDKSKSDFGPLNGLVASGCFGPFPTISRQPKFVIPSPWCEAAPISPTNVIKETRVHGSVVKAKAN